MENHFSLLFLFLSSQRKGGSVTVTIIIIWLPGVLLLGYKMHIIGMRSNSLFTMFGNL